MKYHWRRRDKILLLERLELYVSSGLAVNQALKVASEGGSKKQCQSIAYMRTAVESGGSLARALSVNVKVSRTISGLIEHGESSGGLARALGTARSLLEREDELLKKCLSAMAYPVIVGIFASILTVGLIRGVMPEIIPMLESLHVRLPILTRIVIAVSEGFLSYGLIILVSGIVFAIGTTFLFKRMKKVRYGCQMIFMRLPIAGKLVSHYAYAIFLRSCGSLIEAGVPVDETYSSTVSAISLLPMRSSLEKEVAEITRGISLGSILLTKKLPPYVAPLLSAGEASGNLGVSIIRAADIIDHDIEHALKRLTALVEPVMMAGMGTVVGAIALSIMMPIYDISKVLQK